MDKPHLKPHVDMLSGRIRNQLAFIPMDILRPLVTPYSQKESSLSTQHIVVFALHSYSDVMWTHISITMDSRTTTQTNHIKNSNI